MREAPPVLVAALSSHYRFEREIGSGGMATVYLARDLRHDRDVAIKVMRPDIAAAVGADRFLAEIKTTAQLKHPHILPLFDSGSADTALFYVMPFIEGESLRRHIGRLGPLPIGEAVRILRQLGDALAHAHARGIVHRDVKADNVLVSDRHAFLADFGIARALASHASGQTVTGTGMMAGTPGYMAPEQIVGGAVDHRTDIYAFGTLAYELLTGSPPFTGAAQDVVNAQLTRSPEPVTRHRPDTPPALAALVMRCLQRDASERWQRTDDLLAVLDSIAGPETAAVPRRTSAAWTRAGYALLALVAAAAVAVAWYATRARPKTSVSLAVGRITHVTSDPGLELDPAISPDGRTVAYAAGPAGRMRIYLRQVTGGRSVPLTEGNTDADAQRWPRWSSDGTRIVFQGGRQQISARVTAGGAMLYQVSALGGIPRRILGAFSGPVALSPSWSSDGREIVFGGSDGLYAVAADGDGTPRRLIEGTELYLPRWSPDGSRIAYVKAGWVFTFGEEGLGNVSTSSIFVATPATGRVTRISPGEWLDTNPTWMPDGRTLLFISSRGGGRDIYSVRMGPDREVEQPPERLTSGLNAHTMSLSADGRLLAYASYAANANIWAIDIPENGVASVADAEQITFSNEKIEKLAVTPDGQWLAYDSDRNGQADIWKVRLPGGTPEQVTRGPNHKFMNDWSPDGREILFHTIRSGQRDVFVVSADGLRTEPVATTARDEQHSAWGPDGNTAIFDVTTDVGAVNEWQAFVATRPQRGAPWGTARQLTKVGASDPKWSPDGRWIAYCVRGQLRVIAPDGTGDRALIDVTSTGGPEPSYPVWSRDGRTIYYKAYDRDRHSSIWSVPIAGGTPRVIVRFDDPSRRSQRREFATDGRRFYFTVARDESDVWVMELLTK
jgi:eukaryotic-like serine/threonine-protein kinase